MMVVVGDILGRDQTGTQCHCFQPRLVNCRIYSRISHKIYDKIFT